MFSVLVFRWFIIFFFFCTTPDWPEFHTLKIHHGGGLFKEDGILSYCDGKVTHVDWVNSEEISFANLEGIVYDIGYKRSMELYYKYPGSQVFEEILSNQEMLQYLHM